LAVGIFVHWIYTKQLIGLATFKPVHFQITRIKAAIFGDRFLAPGFSKAVRYELVRVLLREQNVCCEAVIYAYENLPSDDYLLQDDLFVDVLAQDFAFNHRVRDDTKKRLPKEFLFKFMERVLDMMQAGDDFRCDDRIYGLSQCDYHGHYCDEDFEECEVGDTYTEVVGSRAVAG
jgi:hypothetical protein